MLIALLVPMLVGVAALALDSALWANAHTSIQGAADAAAASAARVYSANLASTTSAELSLEADAIAAQYGFVNGQNGVTVTMNWPPTGTAGGQNLRSCNAETLSANDQYFGDDTKFEVIISRTYSATLSSIGVPAQTNICGRAVASLNGGGICILALDGTAAGAFSASGNANIALSGCGLFSNSTNATDSILLGPKGSATVTATNGGQNGAAGAIELSGGSSMSPAGTPNEAQLVDPYSGVAVPTSGTATSFSSFTYTAPTTTCNTPTSITSPVTTAVTLTAPPNCYKGTGKNGLISITTGCLILSTSTGTYTFSGTGGIQVSGVPTPSGCNGKSISIPATNTATINVNGPISVSSGSLTINGANLNVSGYITVG